MSAEPVPLSVLALDLPVPAGGWPAELVVLDDLGRAAVSRETARALLAEARSQQEAAARKREELERQAVAADQRFRASLPAGIPAGAVPEGISAGQLMMLSDPQAQGARRRSVLEDALAGGGIVFHPVGGESS
jgi:hypothetical protein